jgi:hypothetical protein
LTINGLVKLEEGWKSLLASKDVFDPRMISLPMDFAPLLILSCSFLISREICVSLGKISTCVPVNLKKEKKEEGEREELLEDCGF